MSFAKGTTHGSSSSISSLNRPPPIRPTPVRPNQEPRSSKTINQSIQNQQYAASSYLHPSSFSTTTGSSSSGHHLPQTPHTPTGFRAHFNQLLPKHATFRVRVIVHQLASVPLVHGEFGLRWKFRSVQNGQKGLLGRGSHKGKGREVVNLSDSDEHDNDHDHDHDDLSDIDDGSLRSHNGGLRTSIDSSRDPPPLTSNSRSHSHLGLSGLTVRPPNTRPMTPSSQAFPTTPGVHSFPSSASRTPPSPPGSIPQSNPKGHTPFVKLHEHNVTWEHELDVQVKWDVNRETGALGGGKGSEMKLVVMQRVVPGDPDAPHQPRLGAVYINLAEYADQGPVTRRYLLSESKTNATLKLTIHVEHTGGETSYIPPPLPKGEILGGIEGLLDNDVYRTRPRALDLYGMYYSHSAQILPDGKPSIIHGRNKTNGQIDLNKDLALGKLSSAFGPKTTETLIEALFNPVPTTDDIETPFTYQAIVPPSPNGLMTTFGVQDDRRSESNRSITGTSLRSGSGGSVSSRAPSMPRSNTSESHIGHGIGMSAGIGALSSVPSLRSVGSRHSGKLLHAVTGTDRQEAESTHKSWWRKLGHGTPSRPRTPTVN